MFMPNFYNWLSNITLRWLNIHFLIITPPSSLPLYHSQLITVHKNLTTDDSFPPRQVLNGTALLLWLVFPLQVMYPELPLATPWLGSTPLPCLLACSSWANMLENWGIHLPLEIPGTLQHKCLATQGGCPVRL